MREIKFRGYSRMFERWLYGSLINNAFYTRLDGKANCQILDTYFIEYDCFEEIGQDLHNLEVVPESVGQYTGLKDFHGDDIFEGDVLEDAYIRGSVVFDEGKFIFEWENIAQDLFEVHDELVITGNSFEDPELLEAHHE